MGKLTDKIAIVVGSTSGIGKAIAVRYAKEGATVIVTGRRKERGLMTVEEIESFGGASEFYELDARNIEACYSLIDYVVEKYGKLDIIEYNSGISSLGDFNETVFGNITEKLWDAVFETNLKSAFFMSQKAMPELVKTKGTIIYTSSGAGFSAKNSVSSLAYGASKAAMIQMTKIMALTMAGEGVRVNTIAPGLTETEILSNITDEIKAGLRASVPMNKMVLSEDIADTALFLASEESKMITGQCISVCGGLTIG